MESEHDQISVGRMDVEWLIVADAVQVQGGKLFMLGGGWDRLTVPSVPHAMKLGLAAAFRIPWNDTNIRHPFVLRLEHEDGSIVLEMAGQVEVGRPPGIAPGTAQRAQFAAELETVFERTGTYRLLASLEGTARTATFTVVEAPKAIRKQNPR